MLNHLFGNMFIEKNMLARMKQIKGFVISFLFTYASICNYAHSQPAGTSAVAGAFVNYTSTHLQEKIYVHTDKSFYVCGEIAWFRLYDVDAFENKPATISKVAYVEVFDDHHKVVLQAKIDMRKGLGSGSFYLPFSLNSGGYVLRAYTNWMKNFDHSLFFEKQITIVNTLKRLPAVEKDTARASVQFFPEGGNLVEGLNSKVAFHIVDKNGKGVAASGVIYNQRNDSVTSFKTLRFGMGYCYLKPATGDTYKAVVKMQDGNIIMTNLPAPYKRGYVMQLVASNNNIRILVESTGHDDNKLFLVVHTRQHLKIAETKRLANGRTEFLVQQGDLGEGVSHFTLLNSERQAVCERLYFKRPGKKLEIAIATNQPEHLPRKKISIDIITNNQQGEPMTTDLSMSVFRIDSLQAVDEEGIESFLWLTSELRGNIENPSYYFNSKENEAAAVTDNLMLTQGWSRFKWENVFAEIKPILKYLPENEGMQLSGQIHSTGTASAAFNVKSFLSVPGQKFIFRTTTSDRDGNILFNIEKFYGRNQIILQAKKDADPSYAIEINSPYAPEAPAFKVSPLNLPDKWKEPLIAYSVSSQVQNVYAEDARQKFKLPYAFDTTQFFGMPDKTYWLDDYTRFISMEEVMRVERRTGKRSP